MYDFLARGALLLESAAGFSWANNSKEIITTALLSMVPTFEGRYALLVGNGMGMHPVAAYFLALICSSIPIPFILWLLRPILDWFYTWPIGFVRKFAAWVEERSLKKGQSVDKLGMLGLFLFVAIPIPGTGVWTGSGIAALFKMNPKHSALVIFLGNITACLITTLIYYGVSWLL